MEKAYDLKVLGEKLKARGLDLAEDVLKGVVVDTMDWVKESAEKSENKVDDLIVGLIAPAKEYVLERADKVDGKVG